jgi:hypothetical protein
MHHATNNHQIQKFVGVSGKKAPLPLKKPDTAGICG